MLYEKIEKDYFNLIKRNFLKMTDMKLVKEKIEKRGYKTSRIYTTLNIKRLTATDEDKNRIEFVLSDKHMYIVISLRFSNQHRNDNDIKIFSTNKDIDIKFLTDTSLEYSLKRLMIGNQLDESVSSTSPINIFLNKGSVYNDSTAYQKMGLVNKFTYIRKRIIFSEINLSKRKKFTEMKIRKKESFTKKVAIELFRLFQTCNVNPKIEKEVLFISNKKALFGYFFYSEIYFNYSFTFEELSSYYENFIIKYIEKNEDTLIKPYLQKENIAYVEGLSQEEDDNERIRGNFKSFLYYLKYKSIEDINNELMLVSEETDNEIIINDYKKEQKRLRDNRGKNNRIMEIPF